jgi:hypothetical protein
VVARSGTSMVYLIIIRSESARVVPLCFDGQTFSGIDPEHDVAESFGDLLLM